MVVSLQFTLGQANSKSMLCPKLLQLSLLLALSYSLSALPRTLGSMVINSTLDTISGDSLDKPSPVCVNNTQHPTWGLTLEAFNFSTCQQTIELIASKLDGRIYNSYDFYSRQVFPSGRGSVGYEAWPLPQGAGAG